MKKIPAYSFIALFLLLLIADSGCKKTVEKIAENYIVKVMTDGRWIVTEYNNGADITADFAPYEFQFKSNGTVDAINNTAVESTGTWTGDASSRTIQSTFPVSAADTLKKLNGTWIITDNTLTTVKASQVINNITVTLQLAKK